MRITTPKAGTNPNDPSKALQVLLERSSRTALDLTQRLAEFINDDGCIPIAVTVRVHQFQLLMIARKARVEHMEIGEVISEMLCDGEEALAGYENELHEG